MATAIEAPPPPPPPPAADARRPPRALRWVIVAAIGWAAVTFLAAATVVALVPVDNPGVQSCGAPAAFAREGRPDVYPDGNAQVRRANGSIDTLTKAEVTRAFAHPCSRRVGGRLGIAAIALAAGIVLGLVALVASMVRWWGETARKDATTGTATTDTGDRGDPNNG